MLKKITAPYKDSAANQADEPKVGNDSNIAKQHSTTNEKVSPQASTVTKITVLKEAPKVMNRPLMLIDGRAYAATWPYVQIEQSETTDENGKVTKHNPPKRFKRRLLTIVRDDGATFHYGEPAFNDLPFSVELPEIPKAENLFSGAGVTRYSVGERVDARILFEQVCEVKDTFIDFDLSITSQREMCELVACYCFATWFLDAFNVIGILWINGDRGSGKTQLLTLISLFGYLGQLLLPSGSSASLRDLADYGGTLCFDEAENLNHKNADPDKRAIFLSGNRRGSTVTLKEPAKNDRGWRNRFVNTYCPRVFCAIEIPDKVLASRAVIVPLVRTSNKEKANSDVWEFKKWPHDYKKLVDDLWMMALANLNDLQECGEKVSELSTLKGRDLEPWRPILAVALWLERKGKVGLWNRMNELSLKYQAERKEFENDDLTTLIIMAVCRHLSCELVTLRDVSDGQDKTTFVLTHDIEPLVSQIAKELDVDIDPSEMTSRKIGKKLAQQRFKKRRESGSGRNGWFINLKRLAQWAESYGLLTAEKDGVASSGTSQTSLTSLTSQFDMAEIFKLEIDFREFGPALSC